MSPISLMEGLFKSHESDLAQVMNLGNLLTQTARKYPNAWGFIQGQRRCTWTELNSRVDALARYFEELHLQPGQRVLVQLQNGLPLFESAWACFKAGLIWVPVNSRLTPLEVSYIAKNCGASLFLTQRDFKEHVKSVSESLGDGVDVIFADEPPYEDIVTRALPVPFVAHAVSSGHPLWFFFTSGTTGHPKAAVLTHDQMAFVVTNHLSDLMPGLNQNQASLVVAPLSHGAGIHALVNVARGVPSVLLSSQSLNELECFELIQAYKISNLFTVPTILKRLADHPLAAHHDLSSLRQVIYAGAPISRVDQLQALKVLGPVIVQYFGLGEVTGNITVLTTDEHLQEEGALLSTCGSARTGMEVAILDEQGTVLSDFEIGEICTRGPAVFAGYWHNPEANEKVFRGGWFHTGDLGFMNERGYLTITGRASDMYITGGSNVYPREVEEALSSLPGVSQVVVFGIEDKEWGESGVAVLVVSPQDSAPSLEDLYAHLSSRLAKYKWPKHFAFWDHIPTSAYGKLVKKDIRDRYLRENAK